MFVDVGYQSFIVYAVSTFLGMVLALWIFNTLWEWYKKPRLKIVGFDYWSIVNDKGQVVGKYLRLIIRNQGRSTAKDCEAHMGLMGEGRFSYMSGEEAMRKRIIKVSGGLCWSRFGNPFKINIPPQHSETLELARLNDNVIQFPTEKGWKHLRLIEYSIPDSGKTYHKKGIDVRAFASLDKIEWVVNVFCENGDGDKIKIKPLIDAKEGFSIKIVREKE